MVAVGRGLLVTRRRGYRATSTDVVINSALSSVVLFCGAALVADDSVVPWAVSVGVGGSALFELLRRNTRSTRRSLASDAPRLTIDRHGQQWLRFKDTKAVAVEFRFEAPGLPVPVTSDDVTRFCKLAKTRAIDARRPHTRIKSKDVLSKGYFTRRTIDPFLPDEYDSIRLVLTITRRWKGRSPGRSGRLCGIERVDVDDYVAGVERDWLALVAQWQKGRAWGRITNLLPAGDS